MNSKTNKEKSSCSIESKDSSCCSSDKSSTHKESKDHWNKVYNNNPIDRLGWFETDLSPMLQLINKINLSKNASIINIGAGSTVLLDELIDQNYTNLIATDISEVALANLEKRVGNQQVKFIVDDLINPIELKSIKPVDLWIDRAVLHFFTNQKDQNTYFNLLKKSIKKDGFVILAQFNKNSAKFCSGLPV
jgi:cyclopropane fatty-acyl-phospholipid synthase-like methyltransferase